MMLQVGIVVTLGHVTAYPSGLNFRIPFVSHLELMSTKIQILEENNIVPTKEGLAVTLDTAVLFRLDVTLAAQLYREIGPDYIHILIEPEAASAVRGLTSESEAKALYSSGRNTIQDTVRTELTSKLSPRGIIIEDVLLKDIKLPDQLTKAIEAKVQAEQEAARMEFVLLKEKQEAQRKAIEAQGVADFQKIVSEGISPELLKWKGIEATEKFADSLNTKIIMVGNSDNNLPVILSANEDK
jgi:regulator of protease activity HflC (stomatin/prohibitin superfamily)